MAIEEWDDRRGRWVLYRNQEEHSKDCDRYPIEKLPKKIFLDTSVINSIVEYPGQIFENAPLPKDVDETKMEDVEALCHIFATGMRANWHIVASIKVIEEINKTRNSARRAHLHSYASELIDLINDDHYHALNLGRVDKAAFGDSPDAGRHDSKLTSVLEVSFGPGPVERRGMGVFRAICY